MHFMFTQLSRTQFPAPSIHGLVILLLLLLCGAAASGSASITYSDAAVTDSRYVIHYSEPIDVVQFSSHVASGDQTHRVLESELVADSPRSILMDLWTSTGGSNWLNNSNWNSDAHICSWYGIVCDANQTITKIRLGENNLVGTIPPSLANLTTLQFLTLSLNDISGNLPDWLCQAQHLISIDFTYTQIAGPILDCWQPGAALTQMIFQNIPLTGNLPPSIGNLRHLTYLDFRGAQLTGPFPESWKNLISLNQLHLSECPLRCSLPAWLGSLTELQYISLDKSQLYGPIPVEFGNLSKLYNVILSDNPGLTGSLPTELSNISTLNGLMVSNTGLSGEIPNSFVKLTNLRILSIDTSGFTGNPFPSLPNSIEDMTIASSKFVGTLGEDFCRLKQMQQFIASNSPGMTGPVPACIADMTGLTSLYLNHCNFQGALPVELFSLTSLFMLDMRDNNFTGTIPVELGQLTQLNQMDFSNNLLTGNVPHTISQLTQLTFCAISNNQLEGDFDLSLLPPSIQVFSLSGNTLSFSSFSTCASSVRSVGGYTGTVYGLTLLELSENPINLPLADILKCLASMAPSLINLLLASNGLYGGLQFMDISRKVPTPAGAFQYLYGYQALITITVSNNLLDSVSVANTLAAVGTLLIIDASNNRMIGSIDDIASNPQRLLLSNNPGLRGIPTNESAVPGWGPKYQLPSFVQIDRSNLNHNDSLALLCPALVGSTGQEFQVDPSYLNWQHCRCVSGYRTKAPEGNWCEPCPAELSCSELMYAPIHAVSNGFYPSPLSLSDYNSDSSLLLSNAVMIPCQFAQRCNPNSQAQYQCANGSDSNSLLCSRCLRGFFEAEGGCQQCAAWAPWLAPIILALCALAFLLVQIGILVAEERSTLRSKATTAAPSNLPVPRRESHPADISLDVVGNQAADRSKDESTSTLLIILTFWLQSQHTLSSVSNTVSNTFSTTGWMHYISSTASLTPLGLECIVYGLDWPSQWWLIVLSPLWLLVLSVLIFFAGRLHAFQLRLRGWLKTDAAIASVLWRRICLRLTLSLWSLAYMGVAQMIFSSWRCERVTTPDPAASFSFLTAAPYVSCAAHQHTNMLIVSIIVFISFTLTLPSLMLWSSWKQRKSSEMRRDLSSPSFTNGREMNVAASAGERQHALGESLLDSSKEIDPADHKIEHVSDPFPEKEQSELNVQSVLATTACAGLRAECWKWQTIITGRKVLLAGIVALVPRGSSIAPLVAIVMLLALLLSHTWIRPFQVVARSHSEVESNWLWSQAMLLGRDFNLLEACLLLQVSALFLAQVLAAAAASQQQLVDAGASLGAHAGVVPTLLDRSALEIVRQIILGVGIALVSIAVLQTAWRLYTKWKKSQASVEERYDR